MNRAVSALRFNSIFGVLPAIVPTSPRHAATMRSRVRRQQIVTSTVIDGMDEQFVIVVGKARLGALKAEPLRYECADLATKTLPPTHPDQASRESIRSGLRFTLAVRERLDADGRRMDRSEHRPSPSSTWKRWLGGLDVIRTLALKSAA